MCGDHFKFVLFSAIAANETEIDTTETPLNTSTAVEIRRKMIVVVQKKLPGLWDSERMHVQSRQELVVRSVVFLQCCTTGGPVGLQCYTTVVVMGRTRVVRDSGALGRRWQACPTVRSSVLMSVRLCSLWEEQTKGSKMYPAEARGYAFITKYPVPEQKWGWDIRCAVL